ACDNAKQNIDLDTVRAVITGRFQVMAQFARDVMHRVYREELKKADRADRESWTLLKRAHRLMVREAAQLDETKHRLLQRALEINDRLKTVYAMKQKLVDIWNRRATTQEHLIQALQEWCREAEATGIESLRHFSRKLRTYTLVPTPV
ncbi:MAG TPA: transposase, partial [Candidatus Methylomirabilis sp.]|nr:transposase [Candidatus Methylomirabilis sp.]